MTYSVFSKPNCPQCLMAKALLKSKDISYNEYVLQTEPEVEAFKERFPDVRAMPYILINGWPVGDRGTYGDLVLHLKK